MKRRAFLSNIFLLFSLIMVVLLPSKPFKSLDTMTNGNILQFIYIFMPAMIYASMNEDSNENIFKIRKLDKSQLIKIIILSILMIPITTFIANVVSCLLNMNNTPDVYYGKTPLWFILFSVVFIPTICEETFFRGAILHGYQNAGVWKGIITSAFVFGLFHLNLYQFSYTFVLGVVMAASVHYTQSILSSMIIHGVNNLVAVILTLPFTQRYTILNILRDSSLEEISVLLPISIMAMIGVLAILGLLSKDCRAYLPLYEKKRGNSRCPIHSNNHIFSLLYGIKNVFNIEYDLKYREFF
ncbi:CPBP family intramembrane metalloprotease [Clostridium cadaveris]|uniref:CPBP family glutamic-type intramembrane protease n=1 Tax=Clostridium cadaveris TaxID=1529 RepID=UPI001E51CFFE|nr:CPBP family intramembrane glutamic endopeptidase [Clostridium cadaveris]UFH65351.1 CPBP family intramembrane metalloprotease [Clostridium cadaveris]